MLSTTAIATVWWNFTQNWSEIKIVFGSVFVIAAQHYQQVFGNRFTAKRSPRSQYMHDQLVVGWAFGLPLNLPMP
jgi:hypothetical protein